MQKFYLSLLLTFSTIFLLQAQMTVNVPPGDSTLEAAIGVAVDAGTANETTFVLARGGTYILTADIRNEDFHLTIEGEDGTGERPIIKTREKNRPFRLRGDFTMKGIDLSGIALDGEVDNHMIRTDDPITIIIDDCHISGNYASAFRLDEPTVLKITNTVFTNFIGIATDDNGNEIVGTEEDRQGVVVRDRGNIDSLIVENCSFYNIGGEVYKNSSEGDTKNFISFNNCTFVNVGGTGLELDETLNATVTNCQFYNVGLLGAESINDSSTYVYGIRLAELDGQSVSISNNNFFLEQFYIDNLPDTSRQVSNLNAFAETLADTASFIMENVQFNMMPMGYSYETGWTRMVEADFGYNQGFDSYTGGTDSGVIGDTNWDFGTVSNKERELFVTDFICFPNPADHSLTLSFNNKILSLAKVDIISTTGIAVMNVFNGNLVEGINTFNLDVSDLPSGLYMSRVQTNGYVYLRKFVVK